MTSFEPDIRDDMKLGVTQVEKVLQIHRNTLSKLVDKGLIKCKIDRSNSRKVFEGKEIKRFWRTRY